MPAFKVPSSFPGLNKLPPLARALVERVFSQEPTMPTPAMTTIGPGAIPLWREGDYMKKIFEKTIPDIARSMKGNPNELDVMRSVAPSTASTVESLNPLLGKGAKLERAIARDIEHIPDDYRSNILNELARYFTTPKFEPK